jgi:hypothetical protein
MKFQGHIPEHLLRRCTYFCRLRATAPIRRTESKRDRRVEVEELPSFVGRKLTAFDGLHGCQIRNIATRAEKAARSRSCHIHTPCHAFFGLLSLPPHGMHSMERMWQNLSNLEVSTTRAETAFRLTTMPYRQAVPCRFPAIRTTPNMQVIGEQNKALT